MALESVDNIIKEKTNSFAGRDGFNWWVGEIEDNADPMNLGRVKCRVLHYYTDPGGGSATALPTEELPWATVLQHTSQPGNDGQGESSGQLQPGAIVMGFFLDGSSAQMPIVMGVIRTNKGDQTSTKKFMFTGEEIPKDLAPNPAAVELGTSDTTKPHSEPTQKNTVKIPGDGLTPGSSGSPENLGNVSGVSGSAANSQKPRNAQVPAANGVKGPGGTLLTGLTYLVEDIATTAGQLVKNEEGDLIDIIDGKLVTFETLTGKLRNFLSGVFAQVVAFVREKVEEIIQTLTDVISSAGAFIGIPGPTLVAVQELISAILDQLCGIDDSLIGWIMDPIGELANIVNGIIDGAISVAEGALRSFEEALDSILCGVQDIISSLQTIIDTVQAVSELGEAIGAIDFKSIFSFTAGADMASMDVTSILGFLTSLLSLIPFPACDRQPQGGEGDYGWYPFFGVTACGPELSGGPIDIGDALGACGTDKMGTSFLDGIMECAVPYMTQATNYLSGGYDLNIGTPGKQATVKKTASGSTEISVKTNQKVAAEARARAELRAQGVTDPDKIEKEVEKYVTKNTPKSKKSNNPGEQNATASFVADHTIKAGNHTQEVHGDDCKTVDKDYCRTISGDYRLKVSGDCHIEVGGGFFLHAAGGPKTETDEKGKSQGGEKPQKHTINFGSDVELKSQGATFKMHASEFQTSANKHTIVGGEFANECGAQTYAGGEFVVTGSMINVGCTGIQFNVNPTIINPSTVGFNVNVGGPITFTQFGVTPVFTIANPLGACITKSLSWSTDTEAAITLTAKGAVVAAAGLAMTLKAEGATAITSGISIICTAPIIKLN